MEVRAEGGTGHFRQAFAQLQGQSVFGMLVSADTKRSDERDERLTQASPNIPNATHQDANGAAIPTKAVGGIVAAAVAEIRAHPDVPAAELETGPTPDGITTEAWRRHVSTGRELTAQHRLGVLALEVRPRPRPPGPYGQARSSDAKAEQQHLKGPMPCRSRSQRCSPSGRCARTDRKSVV